MSKILLSIKPEYANRIFDETKKYEFRKHIARKDVTKIFVYSTSPVMEIIGEVEVTETLSMSPTALWELTKAEAGISRSKFREYFRGCKIAYAYKLTNAKLYNQPESLDNFGISQAPQSFIYIDKNKK